jgi:hypothetical protein
MTPFQQDLLKILFDKLLLGVVAAGFGFYLARLLENYRNRKSYELFVWQQRVDACRSAARIVTEHYFSILEAFEGLKAAAEKGAMSMEDENAKKMLAFAAKYPQLRNELMALTPFLVPHVSQAAIDYLNETGRISDLVKGKYERGVPTKEELSTAHSKFHLACAAVIDAGPGFSINRS